MASSVAFPILRPALAPAVLRAGFEERQVLLEDVLDAQEHVAKSRLSHQRRQVGPVIGNRRGHGLDQVLHVVQAGVHDRAAERLEPGDIERDVVVDEEDGSGAAGTV